ncbi:hypothetical protein BCF59_0715 [Mycoplasmopsis mustelae]|uniref:Transmembrane protein n=1 Tax=Mycoplasmopsis mustelae TaxID=171289 RepID=A0A4R7UBV0_9BACT|nr:hypothetical protein [Mycoplasmopsis mustelae]TDV22866.1 hypothetical protein BCF59_0715 [Mycoplasmopsis mustelae]
MSRKVKKLLKCISLISVTASPIVALSMQITTQVNINKADSTPNNPEKPDPKQPDKPKPTVAPNFKDFAKIAKDKIKITLASVIDTIIANLKNELEKLQVNKDNAKPTDNEGLLTQISKETYLNQFLDFLQTNKTKIAENSKDFGIDTIFPKIISQDEKINKGNVTFNGQTYNNVSLGTTSNTDYINALKTDKKSEIKFNEENTVNAIKKDELDQYLVKYGDLLFKNLQQVFYDTNDITIYQKDFNLTFDKGNYKISNPKGYKSWKDYFIDKIKPRFTAFDLKANQEITTEQQQQQQQQKQPDKKKPDNPSTPGLPSVDKPIEYIPPEQQIQKLPTLIPNISYQYAKMTTTQVKQLWDVSTPEVREKIFFFANPINTRYEYKITDLQLEDTELEVTQPDGSKAKKLLKNQLVPTIEIVDRINGNHRSSPIGPEGFSWDNDELTKRFEFLYQQQNQALQNAFGRLYTALGIDDKLNYDDLQHQDITKALFGMVTVATNYSNDKKTFIDSQQNIINEYANKISSDVDLTEKSAINQRSQNTFLAYVLTNLKTARIQETGYYATLSQAFEKLLLRAKAFLSIAINKTTVENNLKNNNFSSKTFNEFFKELEINVYKLKQLSQPLQSTFNILNWYDSYITELSLVSANMRSLYQVLQPKDITDEKNKEVFIKAYENMQAVLNERNKKSDLLLRNIGIALLVIGAVFSITNAMAYIVNFKNKNKKMKTIYIITAITIVLFLAVGSVFLGIGLKGI